MKKLKRLCMIVSFLIISFASTASINAYADTDVTISSLSAEMNSARQVTVSGTVSSGSGQIVNVRVAAPDGVPEYAGNITSKESGRFTLAFTMKSTAYGSYYVTVKANNMSEAVMTSFAYGTDNTLDSITVSNGVFDKNFSPDIAEYEIKVTNSVNRIRITPTAGNTASKVAVNGILVESGSSTGFIDLSEGENIIKISVTALSGEVREYILTVIRDAQAAVGLTASASMNASKKVTVSGTISSGSGQTVLVRVIDPEGNVDYANEITSTSGGIYKMAYLLTNKKTGKYTVEAGAANATSVAAYFFYVTEVKLESLDISNTSVTPDFDSGLVSYTAVVDSSFSAVTVTPVASEGTAKITVNGKLVDDSGASQPISLSDKDTVATVKLTAVDESVNRTYTVTIRKKTLPIELSLKAEISSNKIVTISGNINKNSSKFISLRVTDPSGKTDYVNLAKCYENGKFKFAYTLQNKAKGVYNVSAGVSGLEAPAKAQFTYDPNADLSNLVIMTAPIFPQFSAEQTDYYSTVNNNVSAVSIIPTAKDENEEITVNGNIVKSGMGSPAISLNEGNNSISVVVTSMGITKTYIINITRERAQVTIATPVSSDANLSNLAISGGSLDPVFSASMTDYSVSVGNGVASVMLTPTLSDSKASVKVNGMNVSNGMSSAAITINDGENQIPIVVTAQNGTTKTYMVTVTKAALSSNANLSNLAISEGSLDPVFNASTTDYSVSVGSGIASVMLSPTLSDSNATVTVNGIEVSNGTSSAAIAVSVGENQIPVVVTAQNGTTKTYMVTVTKAALSTNANLGSLTVDGKNLYPEFDPENAEIHYSIIVIYTSNPVSIKINLSASDSNATVKIGETEVNGSITLAVVPGDAVIINVTAQDGVTVKTYYIHLSYIC